MSARPLATALVEIVGQSNLLTDQADREYYSQDISGAGETVVEFVVRPGTVTELQETVRACTAAGFAVVPRGGGMSYTLGYVPTRPQSVTIDLTRLNRIREVNTVDRYVVVEAGCTWGALYEALNAVAMRTPFFGPLSGHNATIGGALSQHASFFGSAGHGGVAESVLGLTVVLADGELVRTGAGSGPGIRPTEFGPNATQLFLGECGAFGIKAETVLRTQPVTDHVSFASFAFDQAAGMARAQIAMAGDPGLSECFGFDPQSHANLAKSGFSVLESAQIVGDIAKSESTFTNKVDALTQLVTANKRFVKDLRYSLHVVVEGEDPSVVSNRLDRITATAESAGGTPIPDVIARVTRSRPFRPIKALLGPEGELWLPVHAVFRLSESAAAAARIETLIDSLKPDAAKLDITMSRLCVSSGSSIIQEVHLFWPDRLTPFHLRNATSDQRQRYANRTANPTARAAAHAIRAELAAAMRAAGGWHLQVGKYYPFASEIDAETKRFLAAIKQTVDPKGLMNPGSLNLTDEP